MFAGIFHIVRRYCYQSGRFDQETSTYCGYFAVSTVIFELFYLGYKYYTEEDCNYFLRVASYFLPYFECNTSFGKILWRLNVVNVLTSLVSDSCVLLASTLGSSFGALVSSFFDKLSWLVFIPATLIATLIALFSVMAIFRYEVNILHFLQIRPSSIPIQKPPSRPRSPPPSYSQAQGPSSQSVRVIREIYQSLAP